MHGLNVILSFFSIKNKHWKQGMFQIKRQQPDKKQKRLKDNNESSPHREIIYQVGNAI